MTARVYADPFKERDRVLTEIEDSLVDPKIILEELLNMMSTDEGAEFWDSFKRNYGLDVTL